jgi:predicted dehydrogenase
MGDMSTALRVGVIGCGYWGPKHVRVLHGMGSAVQLAVVDAREDRLAAIGRSFPAVRTFRSLAAALPEVDAVIIATPPTSHTPLALQAIAAGKHVLVEKPLATCTADALRMVEAAEQAGVVLMVGHTFEHNPAVWRLRDLVRGGELGSIHHIHTARLNLGLYQNDVNVVFDLAPHDVSILNYVLGEAPDSVEAWGSRHAHREHEDIAYVRLNYARHSLSATIHVSWLDPCKVRTVTAVGSRKMAVYDDLSPQEPLRVYDKGVVADVGSDQTTPPMSYRYGDITSPYVESFEPLAVQDERFVQSIATGSQPLTDGRNGLAVVQVLDAAQLSMRQQHRVVELAEVTGGSPTWQREPITA